MKALFNRNQPKYPEHHNPDFTSPYYPGDREGRGKVSRLPANRNESHDDRHNEYRASAEQTAVHRRQNGPAARTTLDALQIIRRRFEQSQEESQAA